MRIFKNICHLLLGSAFLLPLASCNSNDPDSPGRPQKPRKDITLTRSEQDIVNGHAKFAFELFNNLKETEANGDGKPENVIISPLSLSLDLSMFSNAIDDTNLARVLNLMNLAPSTTREELNTLSRNLVDELLDIDSQVIMKISNSVWTRPELTVKESFADEIMRQYNAPCTPIAFWEKESENIINGWVKKATDGLITEMHKADPSSIYIITQFYNALYFNAEWVYKFEKNKTVDRQFTNLDGKKVTVPMMHGETSMVNIHDDNRSIIGLPFGNGAYRMFFILPDKGENFEDNIAEFSYERWSDYKNYFYYNYVDMSIPRFDLDTSIDLTDTLMAMGLSFDAEGTLPLPNMFEEDIKLTHLNIFQKCAFKLEEAGVKAAAVTKIEGDYALAPMPIETFEIDRPFMFIIEEQSTGTILFMGKVVEL